MNRRFSINHVTMQHFLSSFPPTLTLHFFVRITGIVFHCPWRNTTNPHCSYICHESGHEKLCELPQCINVYNNKQIHWNNGNVPVPWIRNDESVEYISETYRLCQNSVQLYNVEVFIIMGLKFLWFEISCSINQRNFFVFVGFLFS